jgi:hypothetical protein
VTFKKGLGRLGRKRDHEAVVRVRKVHCQIMRLALHAGDHHQRLAEVGLRFARWMREGNEHLPAAQRRRPHIVLHYRVAAREPMFFF